MCRYGVNGVCPSLPVDGVSDRDYEDHVARDHVSSVHSSQSSKMSSKRGNRGCNMFDIPHLHCLTCRCTTYIENVDLMMLLY